MLTAQYDLSGESTIPFNIGSSNGKWTRSSNYYVSYYITVPASAKYVRIVANATNGTVYAMLASTDTRVHGDTPVYATECARTFLPAGEDVILPIPFDCAYIWVTKTLNDADYSPVFFGFNTAIPDVDTTLTIPGASADAAETGRQIGLINESSANTQADLSAISGSNRNLWPGLATEEFVGTKTITFPEPLPVGIYRFSALVTSSDTDSTVSRVQVLMESGNTIFNISRNFRSGDAFNATAPITGVVFLASRTTPLSANDTAVFADIQLERGQYETSYTPHALSAVDKIVRFTLLNTKYVSTSGDDTNEGDTAESPLRNIQTAINKGANIIYVNPGTYDESILLNGRQNVIITRNRMGDTDTNTNPRVVINGSGSLARGIIINNCNGVTIDDIEIANCTQNGLRILKSRNIKVQNCIAHDIYSANMLSDIAHGYLCEYSNVDFYNCLAYNIGTNTIGSGAKHSDGFNIHYTGTVNLYDCKAYNCEDDGVSHHDGCEGAIYGGEFYQCGKGGVASPTHGAKVNVYNVYSHNNKYGLYVESSTDFTSRGSILLNSCAFVNNSTKDVYADSHYDIIDINCKYNTVSASNITTI